MTQSTDVPARTAKISTPVADGDFPVSIILAKGFPGSAKARVSLRLRTPDGIEPVADAATKGLKWALEASLTNPPAGSGLPRDAGRRRDCWPRRA